MTNTLWHQRLEEARRAIQRLAQATQGASTRQPRSTNIRVASHRNVKVVGNFGHPNATQTAFAHQVAPIRQQPGDLVTESSQAAREGGDARHEAGRA